MGSSAAAAHCGGPAFAPRVRRALWVREQQPDAVYGYDSLGAPRSNALVPPSPELAPLPTPPSSPLPSPFRLRFCFPSTAAHPIFFAWTQRIARPGTHWPGTPRPAPARATYDAKAGDGGGLARTLRNFIRPLVTTDDRGVCFCVASFLAQLRWCFWAPSTSGICDPTDDTALRRGPFLGYALSNCVPRALGPGAAARRGVRLRLLGYAGLQRPRVSLSLSHELALLPTSPSSSPPPFGPFGTPSTSA